MVGMQQERTVRDMIYRILRWCENSAQRSYMNYELSPEARWEFKTM